MNLLITGATGFIGYNLVENLKSEYNLHFLLRKGSDLDKYQNKFYFDQNVGDLHDYIVDNKIIGIVHLASLYLSKHNENDIKQLIDSNIYLGTALLEASLNTSVKWFLNTGTFWQHYISDSLDYCPVNLYAATKQSFIDIAKFYTEISNIQFVTLKICDTYGLNDIRPKLFNLWQKISQTGEELLMSPGEQYIDILYIDDVVSGFLELIKLLNEGSNIESDYALYAQKLYQLKELSRLFEEVSGKKLNIKWGGRAYRQREVMEPWSKGRPIPGWSPRVDIKEGIAKFLDAE